MYYPTYKCRQCGTIETDFQDEHQNLYTHEMKLCSDLHKIHICKDHGQAQTLGVMELIGFHKRDE